MIRAEDNPQRADVNPIVAFDWSGKGVDITFDGETSERIANLDALLDRLDRPYRIVGEASYESYIPELKTKFLADVAGAGHDFRIFHPRYTARLRKALDWEKSDSNDSLLVYQIGTKSPHLLRKATEVDEAWKEKVQRVNREHTIGRYMGDTDGLVEQFITVMGPLTGEQEVLYKTRTGEWRKHFIAGIVRAAMNAETRNEFERLTGLYANGYGSHLRSDINHWGYSGGMSGYKKPRMDWKTLRREVRMAYHRLRQGMHEPETGISLPA